MLGLSSKVASDQWANPGELASQRNLNNVFAYDLVPSPSVLVSALKAARRVNDFPTAVRVFEGEFINETTWGRRRTEAQSGC